MKTSKDEDWLTVGFGEIVELKKLFQLMLENYKFYWYNSGVTNWDYEIRESDQRLNCPYGIEIWCGIVKVCIMRQEIILTEEDFAKQAYQRLALWKRMLIEVGTAGAVKLYQDTVLRYRDESISNFNKDYGKNPITVVEGAPLTFQCAHIWLQETNTTTLTYKCSKCNLLHYGQINTIRT